jgi:hypothetical protein
MDAPKLAELGENLLSKKGPLNSLHQEIAENFYPQRADFTVTRWLGEDFASNLMSSYPVIACRDLQNQIGMMLRPTARPWFHVARKFSEGEEDDTEVRQHLEYFETVMRRAMYDPPALFNKATKEADGDFAAFGQAALSVELNKTQDQLLFRCWHLRDMAWQENSEGQLGFVVRRWKTGALRAQQTFGKDRLHEKINKKAAAAPFEDVIFLHMVCDAEMYDDKAKGRPRWSIWWDVENKQIVEAVPIWGKHYIIPRWQVVSSQYAYSPAVVAALPDARLIQAMTFSLLEVGEKAANPPMIATKDAIRSDMAVYAGGVTWVDNEYDEKTGEVLRPISQDFRGISFGMEMTQDTRAMIKEAFFLNKLSPFNPSQDPQMTAYQAGQLVQEYIRNAMPIFEPMEEEYNAGVCDEVFGIMVRGGAFGSPLDWPKEMHRMEVEFRFESPLHDAIEQEKGQKWLEAKALLADAIALDQSSAYILDAKQALRDALAGIRVPAKWINTEDEVNQMALEAQEAQENQQIMEQVAQGAQAAESLAAAGKDMAASE